MALSDASTIWDVYLKWCEYQLEKHDKDDFTGVEEQIFNQGNRRVAELRIPPITASETDVFKNYTGV